MHKIFKFHQLIAPCILSVLNSSVPRPPTKPIKSFTYALHLFLLLMSTIFQIHGKMWREHSNIREEMMEGSSRRQQCRKHNMCRSLFVRFAPVVQSHGVTKTCRKKDLVRNYAGTYFSTLQTSHESPVSEGWASTSSSR